MSKQAAAGGERPSRARATNTAPARPPSRHLNAGAWREGAPRDGAGTSAAAMPARLPGRASNEYVTFREPPAETSVQSVHPGEADAPAAPPQGRPWYTRPSFKPPPRQAVEQPSYQYGSFPDQEPRTMPVIERVTTLKQDDSAGHQYASASGGNPPQHHGWTKSPTTLPLERKKERPVAFCFTACFTACCILFWLLVIAVGVAVLVVYLLYHPQPPRLRVEDATLNAGYIDELPRRRLALNSDLSVLAAISNPNTKIDIVMRYMELDLYFEGNLIGTTAVWPAPLHEGPGGYVLRDVHIVVSEVVLSREDAMVWQNATAKGGPVALHLAGRFHAQLNFGRWLPFRYWVYPRCTLWFDPPPIGTLRRVRC